MPPASEPKVLVIGVGNILWADEGFGVRCVEALGEAYDMPANVRLVDGGTQGLYLVDLFRDHDHVLLFDAVDFGGVPGSMRVVRDGDIPAFIGQRAVSLHQTGMQDVIAVADLMGARWRAMTLVGVQPVDLEDYGGSLTPEVRFRIPEALAIGLDELTRWGVEPRRRANPAEIVPDALSLNRYERERPRAEDACRIGDERVLAASRASAG